MAYSAPVQYHHIAECEVKTTSIRRLCTKRGGLHHGLCAYSRVGFQAQLDLVIRVLNLFADVVGKTQLLRYEVLLSCLRRNSIVLLPGHASYALHRHHEPQRTCYLHPGPEPLASIEVVGHFEQSLGHPGRYPRHLYLDTLQHLCGSP